MDSPSLIEVRGLFKSYSTDAGPVPVLKGVDLRIVPGEFLAIMGPSGSGKSTFMNILGGLDDPSRGDYFLNGCAVSTLSDDELAKYRNQTLGFVFQGYNLLPRSSLINNVALPLIYSNVPRDERLARASAMLDKVGLLSAAQRRPGQISGGQQQRVAIARALVNRPKVILADEPTGNLDTKTSEDIMALFQTLNGEGITIVLVTHEPDIALFAKRLVRFTDGRIVYDGPVTPAAAGVAPTGAAL